MEQLRAESPADHNLTMDWSWEGDESDEESKLRAETRKIMELPDLPVSATCVRVPVLVSHSEAIWAEFDDALSPQEAAAILREAASVKVIDLPGFPTPADAAGGDEILVGRIREDRAATNGITLYLSNDNLRKGAALNAIQIAELVFAQAAATA
jgi:aspartate-semialdehyde dehydrogenase